MTKYNLKNIIYFFKYLKPYWKKEVMVWFLSFALAALSLVHPYLAKLVIDKAYAQKDLSFFIKLLILGGTVFVVSSLFQAFSSYLKEYIDTKVDYDLKKTIFKKIENLPYGFFQKRPTGEYIFKSLVESSQVASFITGIAPEFFFIAPKFLLTTIILLNLNWKITIFIFVVISFLYIPTFFISRRLRNQSEKLLDSSQDIMETARETFSNMQLVKVFGKEKAAVRRFIRQQIKNIRINMASFRLDMLGSFFDNWAKRLLLGLITFYGGYNIIKGQMTLGSFTAIMLYINQLIGLQGSLISFFMHRLAIGSISVERLSEILKAWPHEPEDEGSSEFLISSGGIEFKDVGFGYYSNKPVLQHLNFKIEDGSAIGLVGNSGRGKTTLINLIVKLYRISDGQILIDGKDVALIKNKSLREQVGMALQKPILWNDTIRDNIIYSRPKATDEKILRASRIACAHDFIKNLPKDYSTIVGERAVRFSEGQKQRIALARAIIKNPKILVIDEGMSSLDSHTEDNIIDNIKRELKNTTLIIISHRLSTIKKMDRVYFLKKADKISIDSHERLVRQDSDYRELFASQIEESAKKV